MCQLRKSTTHQSMICVAVVYILLVTSGIQAGEVTAVNWFSGVASVAAEPVPSLVTPNNDNVVGLSPNTFFVWQKDYIAIGPVDLVFDVVDSGGVTEYAVFEGVTNNTGLDWGGYHIELGFGTGGDFVKSPAGDGLDFDAPDYDSLVDFNPSPGFFLTPLVTEDDIIASDGIMTNLSYAGDFVFHVDVPDGISEFTIRQSPIEVPEPATLSLFGLGSLLFYRKRR